MQIQTNQDAVEVTSRKRLMLENVYFKNQISGSLERLFLRKIVLEKLLEALKTLQPDYGYIIFDGYRSRETQRGLFESYQHEIKSRNPMMNTEELYAETRKFVAHPDEPSRFEIPPHNSGGAVDVGLTYKNQVLDMGTKFDDLTEMAATDFFENPYKPDSQIDQIHWEQVRIHRRLLYHSLVSVGFINWRFEWWHFDIGNCVWAQELKTPWIFNSMDSQVFALLNTNTTHSEPN